MRASHRVYLEVKHEAMAMGCLDCGTEWQTRLVRRGIPARKWGAFFEADHVNGQKVASLSELVRQPGSTVEMLMEEVAKCEWVCTQ